MKKHDDILFLQESNNIEDVWDGESLVQAIQAWEYLRFHLKLDEETILLTHRKLMLGKLDPRECGYWREQPVWIGGHEGKPWFVIPQLMHTWIERANSLVEKVENVVYDDDHNDLEEEIAQQHIHFESIHPFIDGNGRIGRMLYNWTRVKCGLPIEVIYEKKKMDYYKWFQ
jgi:Fic family protein